MKVLIVDDSAINRRLLRATLETEGHQSLEAQDGVEALERLESDSVDAVISDILMPRMDGFRLCYEVRQSERFRGIPIVLYSATYTSAGNEDLAVSSGADRFLRKPATAATILSTLQEVASQRVSDRPAASGPKPELEVLKQYSENLVAKLEERNVELEAATRRLAALIKFGRELAAERDSERLIEGVCAAALRIIGARGVDVGLLEEDGRTVSRWIARGPALGGPSVASVPAADRGVIGDLVRNSRPARARNPGGDPAALGFPEDHPPVRSWLGAPITSPTRLYGWLSLRDKLEAEGFSEEDERLCGNLAGQAAVAYENALRFTEIERRAGELERRVAERTAELEASRRQDLEAKDRFLSHVSHELRAPLTAIYQFVTILADGLGGPVTSEQGEYLEVVLRNVNQLRAMLGDLREVARAQTGKLTVEPECVSLVEIVRDTLQAFEAAAARQGLALRGGLPAHVPPVHADPARVRQILTNLLDNAIKFTPAGGEVVVEASVLVEEPGLVRVAVRDTGCGVSPEGLTKIFERLYQEPNAVESSRKGLGLGLYICGVLASLHGGRIWAESRPGAGSTFFFTLPVFSLAKLLQPVVGPDESPARPLALIATRVRPPAGPGGAKWSERFLKRAREVVRSTIIPCNDVLLPRTSGLAGEEVIFVVARTDPAGAGSMARRIEEQVRRCRELADAGVRIEATARSVQLQRTRSRSREPYTLLLAASLEEAMKKEESSMEVAP